MLRYVRRLGIIIILLGGVIKVAEGDTPEGLLVIGLALVLYSILETFNR